MSKCAHMNFAAEVDVHRLEDSKAGDGRISGYMADLRIKCAECGRRFQFLGLEPGIDTRGAKVSIDGLEAHLALCPQGEEMSALDRIAVSMPGGLRGPAH